MAVASGILLTVISATVIHISVRYLTKARRLGLFALGLLCLALAFNLGEAFGGFWPGVYTLLSVFFLATVVTPWIDFWLRERRGQ
ncbi:MAG: hypothetical protein AAGA23_15900 [Pseudomonadota bacterium]